MKKKFILLCLSVLTLAPAIKAGAKTDSTKINFENSYMELKSMLEGKQIVSFERAVFISENPYWNNKYSYSDFQNTIKFHLYNVQRLLNANDRSDTIEFSVKAGANGRFKMDDIRYTEDERKEMYRKALENWAIFTYMTDTTAFYPFYHFPFSYATNDPFGRKDWANSQVLNLLASGAQKGNCFALTGLFKILSNRLNTGAKICTAPQHIYIQHQDKKGDFYNVELATAGHPGDGIIQTFTYTTNEAIMSGIALRDYDEKQSIGLCVVNLAKSYEHKFKTKDDEFLLKCAELALKYDSLNLNALLLKQQVLDEKVASYAVKNKINDIDKLKSDSHISGTLVRLQKHTSKLYGLGYRQMPLYMQQMILNGYSEEQTGTVYVAKNPSPFTTVKPKDKSDEQYWTLSHGAFQEVFEHKKLETYGHFTFNTDSKILSAVDTTAQKGFLIDPVAFAYDFGARMYDSRVGIFVSVDPLAHKFPATSPYSAFGNNPIYYTDPDGRAIKAANDQALGLINNVFSSFNTQINGQAATGAELFGFASKDTKSGVFTTSGTLEQFQGVLNQSSLSAEQKEQATAIFKVLSAGDIVEVGLVNQQTTVVDNSNPLTNSSQSESKIRQITKNEGASSLLDKNSRGGMANADIRTELLKQNPSGSVGQNEAYGYFQNEGAKDNVGVEGLILVNSNQQGGDFTRNSGGTGTDAVGTATQAITKSIVDFSKSKEFKKNYDKK